MPKYFLKVDVKSVVLNGFADTSSRVYGTVNIQTVFSTNEIAIQLLSGKSCVAPLKVMTILRLKLPACLLPAKLTHKV